MTGLETLLRQRFHGAANIRGIYFQLLYAVDCALDLFSDDGPDAVRPEGIEDIDLLGMHLGDRYVQAKYSATGWNWAKLKAPVEGFLAVLRKNPEARFSLIVNFTPKKDIGRLARYEKLSAEERSKLSRKFQNLCAEIGGTREEAVVMIGRISIESVSVDQLWDRLRQKAAQVFALTGGAVDTYLLVLLARFLEWAEARQTIRREDIETQRISVAEGIAKQKDFEAVGRSLIDRISWEADQRPDDFFNGKGARPGHIAMELDVRRPGWLERIDQAVTASGICVVRSSSGQGKSALVYRYAYENWPSEHTFLLSACNSQEDAEKIAAHLRFRSEIKFPTFLVIEDAGWRVPFWPGVVQVCSSLGIPVLVGVRHEDWFRRVQESVTGFEVVEPILDSIEAKEIFLNLKKKDRIHAEVVSWEWAYEKIGDPSLLIEYVYLLTHGKMLEERLREQVKRMEGRGTVELLRRVAAAHTAGVPLSLDALVKSLDLDNDPQLVLQSIADEYVSIEGNVITGLHWVRSNHLFQLLHETYPRRTQTMLGLVEIIGKEELVTLISNALTMEGVDTVVFILGLAHKVEGKPLDVISAYLDGVFRGGELLYFETNRSVFDQAREIIGSSATLLIAAQLMPTVRVNLIERLSDGFGPVGERLREKLVATAANTVDCARGGELVRDLLTEAARLISPSVLEKPSGELGILLDWCAFSEVDLPQWKKTLNETIINNQFFSLEQEGFCLWMWGLYRFHEAAYRKWFEENQEQLSGYLMLHLELTELDFDRKENEVRIKFIVEPNKSINEQTMERLNVIRTCLPIFGRYCSGGIWINPFGLKASVDDTHMRIPIENLPCPIEIQKNVVFREAIENAYRPGSYYEFQREWVNARRLALDFLRTFSKFLQRYLEKGSVSKSISSKTDTLAVDFVATLGWLPDPPVQAGEKVQEAFGSNEAKGWATNIENFTRQILDYAESRSEQSGRLSLHNLREAEKGLNGLQNAFDTLFEESTDYFDAEKLQGKECEPYSTVADLVDCWVNMNPPARLPNAFSYIRAHRKREKDAKFKRLKAVCDELEEMGVKVGLPSEFWYDHPLQYVAFVVHVDDPEEATEFVAGVASKFVPVLDVVDYFCFVPVFDGARWDENAYVFSVDTITKIDDGTLKEWERIIPRQPPPELLKTLPEYTVRELPDLLFRQGNILLWASLANLPTLWGHIEPLGNSDCPFKKQLFVQLRPKAEEYARDCRKQAEEMKQTFEVIVEDMDDLNEEAIHLRNFYDEILSAETLDVLLVYISENEIINKALNENLEKGS